ncbi:MAG: T9SS type A sorting domain-containing protein [Bacteroidota bacterium]
MKKLLVIVLMLCATAASAQWSRTSSYADGSVLGETSSPTAIGIYTNSGISLLKSANPVWSMIGYATAGFSPTRFAATDSIIFLTDDVWYHASRDGGVTWSIAQGPLSPQFIGIMGQTLVAIGQDNVVNFSVNWGATWQQAPAGLSTAYPLLSTIMDNQVFALQETGNSNIALYQCTRNGTTFSAWSLVKSFPQFQTFYTIASSGGILYTGTDTGVKRSADKGLTWGYVSDVQEDVGQIVIDSSSLYSVGLSMYDLKRYDLKTSIWTTILPPWYDTVATAIFACNGQFYAYLSNHYGQPYGFYRYAGNRWLTMTALPVGNPAREYHAVKQTGNYLFTSLSEVTGATGSWAYYSFDDGLTWNRFESSTAWSVNDALFAGNHYLVAGLPGVGIADPAAGTITATGGITASQAYSLEKFGNLLYVGTSEGIYTSANDGATWTYKFLKGRIVYKLRAVNGILYAGTDQGLFATTDGLTFGNTTCMAAGITDIAATNTELFVTSVSGLLKRVDSLNAWVPVGTTLVGTDVTAIVAHSIRLYAGTAHGTVVYTDDGGKTWMDISEAAFRDVTGLGFLGSKLVMSELNSGVWIYPSSWPNGIGENGQSRPLTLFPNPVGERLNLRLPGGFRGDISLEIKNIAGVTVMKMPACSVVNGSVSLRVAGLPAGMYIISVRGRDQTVTGRFCKAE